MITLSIVTAIAFASVNVALSNTRRQLIAEILEIDREEV